MNTTIAYTAVKLEFIAKETDQLTITAKVDMHIPGQNGGSVTLARGERFTVVRAASLGPDMWYIVRHVRGEKQCSCPARKPCKHEKAVKASQLRTKTFKIVETRLFASQDHRQHDVLIPEFCNERGEWERFTEKNGHITQYYATAPQAAKKFADAQVGKEINRPERLVKIPGTIRPEQKEIIISMRQRAGMEVSPELDFWSREAAEEEIAYLGTLAAANRETATLNGNRHFSLMR